MHSYLLRTTAAFVALGSAVLISNAAMAQSCSAYSYTLTNGTTADASQVMSNLNTIRNCFNALQSGGTIATPTITTSATVPLIVGGTGSTSALALRPTAGVGTTGADIKFQVGNNGATEAMRVLNSGRVGIGTTSPRGVLDIANTTDATFYLTRPGLGSSYGVAGVGYIHFYDADNSKDIAGILAVGRMPENNGNLVFLTLRGGTLTEAMRIWSNGRVGIGSGTQQPRGALEIVNASDATLYLTRPGLGSSYGAAGVGYIHFLDADNGQDVAGIQAVGYMPGNNGDLSFRTLRSGTLTEALRIVSTGKVGIGTASPTQALDVNGQVRVGTFASASATAVCQNANVLSSCSSSIRYKENVQDARFGLREIEKLRPVTFKWKGRNESDLGFVAEEVGQIDPLFVTYKDGEIEGVKYPQLTAVLTNAVKELNNRNNRHASELADLKKENSALKAEVADLKSQVNRRLSRLERSAGLQEASSDNFIDRIASLIWR